VLGIGIRGGTARDKRYLNPLRYKHHPLKESTAMSESEEERSKEEEEMGTLQWMIPSLLNLRYHLPLRVCTMDLMEKVYHRREDQQLEFLMF
jgi:hypothetical protein